VISTVASLKFWSFFRHDGQFLALQMVKLSSLHDDEGPVDIFYHWRRDTLVNVLPMVVTSLIWGVSYFRVAAWRETRVVPKKDEDSVIDGSLSRPLLAEDDIDNAAADGIILASSSRPTLASVRAAYKFLRQSLKKKNDESLFFFHIHSQSRRQPKKANYSQAIGKRRSIRVTLG
jgi:hypothetical protein